MSILRLYQYLETKRQSNHATGRCSKHDSGERCHEEAHMHQDPSGMLARIPFGLTTGPIEGAEILVAGCRKETVASEMRSNVLKYRDTLVNYPSSAARRLPSRPIRPADEIYNAKPSIGFTSQLIRKALSFLTCPQQSLSDH